MFYFLEVRDIPTDDIKSIIANISLSHARNTLIVPTEKERILLYVYTIDDPNLVFTMHWQKNSESVGTLTFISCLADGSGGSFPSERKFIKVADGSKIKGDKPLSQFVFHDTNPLERTALFTDIVLGHVEKKRATFYKSQKLSPEFQDLNPGELWGTRATRLQ